MKYHHCRCVLCDHINLPGEGEYREFPLPDMCIECYSAVSSALVYSEEEQGASYPTTQPSNTRPEPTSGQETPIGGITDLTQKETIDDTLSELHVHQP